MSSTVARLNLAARRYGSVAVDGWLQLLAPDVTIGRYAQQLARAYGFESSVEAAIAYSPLRAFATVRPCAGYLVEDLLALGIEPARVAQLPQVPVAPFTTEAEALGWLYLLERVAQVHNSIHVHLRARLPAARDAFRYLHVATRELPERARVLAERLALLDGDAYAQQPAVDAVHAAFERARSWFRVDEARAA